MKNGNYAKAYVEVYEILGFLQEEDRHQIPQKFVDMIIKNMDKFYTFDFDNTKTLNEQEILRETRVLLAYIYLNYLGTEEEKAFYNKKFESDLLQLEQVLEDDKIRIYSF